MNTGRIKQMFITIIIIIIVNTKILSTEKSSGMFPRHKGTALISESFALNL